MDLNTDKKWKNLLSPHLSGYNQASNLAQNEMVHKLVKEGQTVYHFGFGQSPFPVMKSAQKALAEHTGENAYLPVAGLPELRASICKFHAKVDNFSHFDADDIVVGPGSKELIFLLMLVFNGDVMMLSPTWTTYKPQALLTQKAVHVIPTSFDKDWKLTHFTFLKLGYSMYPKELSVLKNAVKSAASHTYSCASAPIQHASLTMFKFEAESQDYIFHCRRILSAVADYCYRELTNVGVKVMRPKAGYYMLPDFEILRPYFKKRGITTCQQMCDALFDEARVTVIAGGPAFLRPLDEFTVRFCFVPFNGEAALEASRLIGQKDLPDDFVAENCQNVVDGVQALKSWMNKQMTLTD